MNRVLLLGASGRVGRLIQAAAQARPGAAQIVPVVRQGAVPSGGVLWQPGQPVPRGLRADAIWALWGVVPGGGDLTENRDLALAAQMLAREVGADRVLHCSSVAVYRPAAHPLSEATDTPDPGTPYGAAKLEMERALAAQSGEGPRAVCLRIGNVAGADSLFRAGRAAGQITLDRFADGSGPRRGYIAPGDMLQVLRGLTDCPVDAVSPVLNVAAPGAVAMEALAGAMGWPVAWRAAPPQAVPLVMQDVRLLQSLVPLAPHCADPAHMARDVRATWQDGA